MDKKTLGYKGKGMCKSCAYSSPSPENKNQLNCGWYGSKCFLVSRNCPGIRVLK